MKDCDNEKPALAHIRQLANEERALFERGALSDEETRRLTQIQLELDQYWDLIRQRRAAEETGRDADDAKLRSPGVVKKYIG